MRVFEDIAGLRAAVGSHLGYSGVHTITQQQIDEFADLTGDHNWIHVDAERAAAGPFGTTIAHGFLTLSFVATLVRQVYQLRGDLVGLNYGADKLRFPSPTPVGSQVRAGVELLRVAPRAAGSQVTTRVTIERLGTEKPVCVLDMLVLVVP